MIDHFRKVNRVELADQIPDEHDAQELPDPDAIQDDVIKMMFACCHPSLSTENQLILTLKILGGLSIREIARVLLKKEETVAKSYTRAKKKFKEATIDLALPDSAALKMRLRTVLQVIYLLFTEGYKTTEGDQLIKKDLCNEAIRLAVLLAEYDITDTSMTHSLLALMYFHSARFSSRVGPAGEVIPLQDQDRKKWDGELIDKGIQALDQAVKGAFINEFYVQATISGLHCDAKTYAKTDWVSILRQYDILVTMNPSPAIRLNRVVALAKARSTEEALEELDRLEAQGKLSGYYLLHAIKGDLLLEQGEVETGKVAIERAVQLTENKAEKDYLMRKVDSIS